MPWKLVAFRYVFLLKEGSYCVPEHHPYNLGITPTLPSVFPVFVLYMYIITSL